MYFLINKKFELYKVVGLDRIKLRVLKELVDSVVFIFIIIFRWFLFVGEVLIEWLKEVSVSLVFKIRW